FQTRLEFAHGYRSRTHRRRRDRRGALSRAAAVLLPRGSRVPSHYRRADSRSRAPQSRAANRDRCRPGILGKQRLRVRTVGTRRTGRSVNPPIAPEGASKMIKRALLLAAATLIVVNGAP